MSGEYINVVNRVHQSLKRICGGGVHIRSDFESPCDCHANLPLWSFRHEETSTCTHDGEDRSEWLNHLLELAKSSISLSNGKSVSKETASANSTLDIGKAHDVEIRTALSFFHKYRHVCHRVKLKPSSSHKRNKKRRKRFLERSHADNAPNQDIGAEMDTLQNNTFIPPLEVVSDLGLVRSIYNPFDLSTLLAEDLEDQLWHERTSTSLTSTIATANATTKTNDNMIYTVPKKNEIPAMIRADHSGIVCMVTPQRVLYLYQHGRYPCSRCVKWCKGEKGLWWHEQREHGIDHEHAINIAYATAGGDTSSSLVLYEPKQDDACILATRTSSLSQLRENRVMKTKEESIFDIVKNGNLKALKHFLIDSPITNVSCYLDKNGASILHWSAGCGHLQMVKYLVEELECTPHQPQKGKRSFQGRTPLHWSARNGHLSVVEYLVEKCEIDIDATTQDGTTAFCWASWQGHLDIMVYLHRKGVNTGLVNIFGCNAALWSAQSDSGDVNAIKWLYSVGCDVSLVNSNGHGVLHKSAQRGKDDVCEWILSVAESSGISKDIPSHVFKLMGPDAENCFPSDLAGMEKHTTLARWLALKEREEYSRAFQNYFKNDMTVIPLWLKVGLENARHEVNRVGLGDLWERGAGIRRVCAFLFQSDPGSRSSNSS